MITTTLGGRSAACREAARQRNPRTAKRIETDRDIMKFPRESGQAARVGDWKLILWLNKAVEATFFRFGFESTAPILEDRREV